MFKKKILILLSMSVGGLALALRFYGEPLPTELHQKLHNISSEYPGVKVSLKEIQWNKKAVTLQIQYNNRRANTKNYLATLSQAEDLLHASGIHKIRYHYALLSEGGAASRATVLKAPLTRPRTNKHIAVSQDLAELTEDFVRIREKANTQSPILTYLFRGATVKIKAKSQHSTRILKHSAPWYQIETADNKRGWVYGQYIKATQRKKASSSFHNNKIYKNLIQSKSLLFQKRWHTQLNPKHLRIEANRVILDHKTHSIRIPFELQSKSIQWKVEKIQITDKRAPQKAQKKHNTSPQPKKSTSPQPPEASESKTIPKPSNKKPTQELPQAHPAYNLAITTHPTVYTHVSKDDIPKVKALAKILEYRLFAHDYERPIRFHEQHNPFLDTIHIKLTDIDFNKKHAQYTIERSTLHESTESTESKESTKQQKLIFMDQWLIDFKDVAETTLNYEKMGDFYYSEILLAFSRVGVKSKKEIISLANYTIDLLLQQKYI